MLVSVLTIVLCGLWQLQPVPTAQEDVPPAATLSAAHARGEETGIGVPVHLAIPRIGVDADIISVGKTAEGKMGVPDNGVQTGWYDRRARPGDRGAAVIGGHLELGGAPGVFWRLHELAPGDTVSVRDEHGTVRRFVVRVRERYHVSQAPMDEIFNKEGGRFLHLITCAGTWRTELGHYDERTVVYAELLDEEDASSSSDA